MDTKVAITRLDLLIAHFEAGIIECAALKNELSTYNGNSSKNSSSIIELSRAKKLAKSLQRRGITRKKI